MGCPSTYLSDIGLMSSVEAYHPEGDILVDDIQCKTMTGEEGACSILKEEDDPINFKFNLLTKSEITWKSNCAFDVELPDGSAKRTDNGSFITDKEQEILNFKNIPQSGQVCTVGFLILDIERDNEDIPKSSGIISLVHIVVTNPNYISVPSSQIKFRKKKIEILTSKFSKYVLITKGKETKKIKKMNQFFIEAPKNGERVVVKVQTDISRINKTIVQ